MSVVAIIGAGDLGGALASKLAGRERVREIRLIDRATGVAAGKALDIQQSGPVDATDTRVSSAADPADAARADIIVIADEVGPPVAEIQGEAGLALLRRLRDATRAAAASTPSGHAAPPIVCAGATHAWLVAYAAAELDIASTQIVGSAPLALVSALRALIALELNASAQDVSVTLAGQPPHGIVVPWDTASIHGERLDAHLDPPTLRRLETRLRALWPPGPYALAAAAARIVEALLTGSRRTLCGFVAEPAADGRPRASAWPFRVEPAPGAGLRWEVRAAALPALTAQQRVALDSIR